MNCLKKLLGKFKQHKKYKGENKQKYPIYHHLKITFIDFMEYHYRHGNEGYFKILKSNLPSGN